MIIKNLVKEDFFFKLKNKCPDDDEIERTKEIMKMFDGKNGEELTKLYCKSDVILLTDVMEKFVNVSTEECGNNPSILWKSTWLYLSMCLEIY